MIGKKHLKELEKRSIERDIIILADMKTANGKSFYSLEDISRILKISYGVVQQVVHNALINGKITRMR